ncbi:MAG: PAS domain S-box protein [Myxococcales bacterium]|jgi:PAS domain S-box-containing protein
MQDEQKSREQLLAELAAARRRIDELEATRASRPADQPSSATTEEKLQRVIADAPAAFAAFDAQMRYLVANKRWHEEYGLTGRDIIGRSHYEVFPEIPERWKEIHRRVLAGSTEQSYDDRFDRADGSVQWLRWKLWPWRLPSGEIGGIAMLTEDITVQKRAQLALEESRRALEEAEKRYRVVADWTYDMELWIAPDGALRYMSPSTERVTGWTPQDFGDDGIDLVRLAHPEDRDLVREHCRRAASGEPSAYAEWRIIRRDGRAAWVSASWQPVRIGEEYLGVRMSIRDITARKEAEAALERSEEQYRGIFENSSLGIFQSTLDGRFLTVNRAMAKMLGFGSPDEALAGVACSWDLYGLSNVRERLLEQLKASSGTIAIEGPVSRPDGKPLFAKLTARGVRDEAGDVKYLEGFLEDITERKRAEEALRENEQRLSLIVAKSPDVISLQDRDLRYQWITNAPGPTAERILGHTDEEILAGETAQAVIAAKRRVLSTGESARLEMASIMEGKQYFFDVALEPWRDSEGRIVGIFGYSRDITERKRTEQALRESQERRFRELMEASSDLIWEIDPEARYTYVSPRALDLLGYTPSELIGRSFFELMPEAEARRAAEQFRAYAEQRQPFKSFENEQRRKNGSLLVLESSGVPFYDEEQQFRGYRGIARDVTERRQVDRFREEYVSLVSHDLRSPLSVIVGQAGSLQKTLAKKGLEREAAATVAMLRNARRMTRMLDELADSVRLESGRMQMRKQPTDLLAFARDFTTRVFGTTEERERIELRFESALPPISLDADRIERVLANFISNALKYSAPDRPVRVRIERRGDEAVVSVSDEGPGIAPGELARIFERFYRSPTSQQRAEGLGLGLYISRLIVEAHGGRVWAESELGKGSTFCFSLPIGAEETAAKAGEQPGVEPAHPA